MTEYRNCKREGDHISGEQRFVGLSAGPWHGFEANLTLARIHAALDRSQEAAERIWDQQDGFPTSLSSVGYDWSGIRDSSPEARAAMDAVAREYVSDADLMEMFGLPSDATLAQALLDALKGATETEDESPDDTAIAEAESAICERLAISLDETEQGLTRNAVEQIEAFVSAHATGVTNWTYQDAGFLGVEADGVR